MGDGRLCIGFRTCEMPHVELDSPDGFVVFKPPLWELGRLQKSGDSVEPFYFDWARVFRDDKKYTHQKT